jgi:hypothetical protein
MRPTVSTLACPLPAALMLVLACWLALTTPLRIETSSLSHLHADGSARPLTHEHHLHTHTGLELPVGVRIAEAPFLLPVTSSLGAAFRSRSSASSPSSSPGHGSQPTHWERHAYLRTFIGALPSRPATALLRGGLGRLKG